MALLGEAEHADLVVVGSSGAGAITRFLLGSATGSLLASSPCPVVVVPAGPPAPTSRIVVGTDGSEHADHAVRWAVDEADRRGSELVIVHVWKYGYHLTMGGVDRADDFTPVDAELILDRAVEAARSMSAGNVRGGLVEGSEADTLLELSTTARPARASAQGAAVDSGRCSSDRSPARPPPQQLPDGDRPLTTPPVKLPAARSASRFA